MDLSLKNKVALVAASSKGLGRASAEALAQEGAKVTICARDETALRTTANEIASSTGSEILAIPADVSNAQDIERLVTATLEKFGTLHILVTNAGGPPAGYFEEFDDQQWQAAVNLTLMSTVRLIRAALPSMKEQQWGRIINITSLSVKQPIDNLILSNSIRAAVHGLAKTLANQWGASGITMNNVMPGIIHTDRIEQLAQHRANQSGQSIAKVISGMSEPIPVGRIGRPEELGALVAFLASEKAGYINGVSIPVDGGRINSAF
jgi:3-oxoacyl-[acyl-carrier protein] reductase